MLNEVYLGLGSNLGDRRRNIEEGVDRLREISTDIAVSSFYETAPVGLTIQPTFVNAACRIWTKLTVFELLETLQGIQGKAHAHRAVLNGPRALDIDILLYGNLVIDLPHLRVPHPRITEREFVLRPLAEIAPTVIHPVVNRRISELLAGLER
jgi:2-amino-4-hydroxy-6-hydroxymethyldihydropteridine diphosphokinase